MDKGFSGHILAVSYKLDTPREGVVFRSTKYSQIRLTSSNMQCRELMSAEEWEPVYLYAIETRRKTVFNDGDIVWLEHSKILVKLIEYDSMTLTWYYVNIITWENGSMQEYCYDMIAPHQSILLGRFTGVITLDKPVSSPLEAWEKCMAMVVYGARKVIIGWDQEDKQLLMRLL